MLYSFMPIIQLIILTINGAYLAIIDKIIGPGKVNIKTINLIGNLMPILIFLFWFYKSRNISKKIISATLSMVFMTALFLFMTTDEKQDTKPYWLNFLIIHFASGMILTLAAYLSYRRSAQSGTGA